ncbi:MAG: RiPP maturation radical SAM C-methyltransferase, partial [Blastocatellia bacterium]
LMKKGTTAFQNLLLLKYCLLYDVFPAWNLLIGFPGEEEDVYRKYTTDLPLLAHLPPPTDAYPVRFDRYSPYFVRAKEYGLDLHPYDYYALSYPFDEESLANLAYYFEDRNIVARYMSLMIEWIDRIRDKITWWRTRWLGHDNLMPAKLHFKGNSTVVYDSRSGRVSEHDVGEVGRRVLEFLHRRPSTASAVASGLSSVDAADIDKEMALLQSGGFVFREGDRYLSLVLPRDSPPMTYIP